MKKIVSLILAVMIMFSIGSIATFAYEQTATIALENVEIDVDTATAEVKLNISADAYPLYISGLELHLNIPEGLKLTAVSDIPGTPNAYDDASSNMETGDVNVVDPDGGAGDVIGKLDAAADVTLTFAITDPSVAKKYEIVLDESTGIFDDEFEYATVALSNGSITVKAAGPSVKTITKTEGKDAIVNNATALKDKETDVEIGGAAGFAFTIPKGVTLDDNMIWSLTTADGKLYSEKINAGLSVLTGDVQVAATFITGTHKGADAANTEIKAVNGIFKAGEDFYFTDAADAKNQAAAE